MLLKLPKLYS